MRPLASGERLALPAGCRRILVSGRVQDGPDVGLVGVGGDGTVREADVEGERAVVDLDGLALPVQLVVYVVDDRSGGFVNPVFPMSLDAGDGELGLPEPAQHLAAVILAEVYDHGGALRLRASSEGHQFGIEAYARARGLDVGTFPGRRAGGGSNGGASGGVPAPGSPLGSGSGVLVAPGLVATNAHVVEGGSGFRLEADGARDEGRLVAVDPMHDLALLRTTLAGEPLPLRLSRPLELGEDVIAAGFPLREILGVNLKVTTGNVSGLHGAHDDVSRFQFSAPIGSGSSGGAVTDALGNLVGIASSSLAHERMRERGATSENTNFAIKAVMVSEMIAATGTVRAPVPDHVDGARGDAVRRIRAAMVGILVSA